MPSQYDFASCAHASVCKLQTSTLLWVAQSAPRAPCGTPIKEHRSSSNLPWRPRHALAHPPPVSVAAHAHIKFDNVTDISTSTTNSTSTAAAHEESSSTCYANLTLRHLLRIGLLNKACQKG